MDWYGKDDETNEAILQLIRALKRHAKWDDVRLDIAIAKLEELGKPRGYFRS